MAVASLHSSMHKNEPGVQALDLFHPALQFGYCAALIVFSMTVMQPIYVGVSFLGALSFSVYLRGLPAVLKNLIWQLPLVFLITFVNPLFASVGSTELFRVGTQAVYLESYLYGCCMGLMLVSVLLWFSNASRILSSDKVLALFGNSLPTIGLMISMSLRLVPQFIERGRQIHDTAQACTCSQLPSTKDKLQSYMRLISVLMAWSMEDSLETAVAMKARAWSSTVRRTSYQRYHFCSFDAGISFVLGGLVLLNAVLAGIALSHFHFYPTMSTLMLWWGYLPYAILVFLPLLYCLVDDFRWRLS